MSTPAPPPTFPPLPSAAGSPATPPSPPPVQIHATSQDGLWGVITGSDYMNLPAPIGRTKTADDPGKALNNTWDPANVAPIGPGSVHKYVKVKLSDLPGYVQPPVKVYISPANYGSKSPGPKIIPDYPHTCPLCGGKMLQLFSSTEHEGKKECPAVVKLREAELAGDYGYKFKRKKRP